VDRVGRHQGVEPTLEQRAGDDLVEPLEALLGPAELDQAEADPLVAAQLLEREAEELGRGVDDEDTDPPVWDRAQELVGQDAGAARVVAHEVALAQRRGQLGHGRLEVAVPAVVLDRVILAGQRLDRLDRPGRLRDPLEARRPQRAHVESLMSGAYPVPGPMARAIRSRRPRRG
jgi:hypothetical protein